MKKLKMKDLILTEGPVIPFPGSYQPPQQPVQQQQAQQQPMQYPDYISQYDSQYPSDQGAGLDPQMVGDYQQRIQKVEMGLNNAVQDIYSLIRNSPWGGGELGQRVSQMHTELRAILSHLGSYYRS